MHSRHFYFGQLFTKSTDWFEDVKGWKSTQGGFSAVKHVTTDENNMGGFFVRKMAGAAAVAVHLQKMIPLLVHPNGAQWMMGHFRPLLWTALVGNIAIAAFYGLYLEDLTSAGVAEMTYCILSVLAFESLVILYHLLSSRHAKKSIAVRMPSGKTPSSPPSKIVARTVAIVSTAMLVIFGRDLFLPGTILDFFPRDDIYLEWTNAFLHSPPQGSPEAMDQGLEAPLYIGDKFISQLMALHIMVLCMYKFVTAFLIRYGNDGSGLIKAKMIWKVQAVGDGMILFLFRIFTPAAASASLDLRWHLMALAYEMFILGKMYFFIVLSFRNSRCLIHLGASLFSFRSLRLLLKRSF